MPQSIGDAVRRLRRARNWSQEDVASRSGGKITKNWLGSLEVGRIKHSNPEMLGALAKVFGITITDIYREAGIEAVPPESPTDERSVIIQRILKAVEPLSDDQKIALIDLIERLYPQQFQNAVEKKKDETRVGGR